MSTQGRFKVVTAPDDVFIGTAVGDFAISSSNGVFIGALPVGSIGQAHMKFDEEGVVSNEPLIVVSGVYGDVNTSLINPLIAASGIQINSGAGTIKLDQIVVDDNDLVCDTSTSMTSVTTPNVYLPTAWVSCPAAVPAAGPSPLVPGRTQVMLNPAAPFLDVNLSGATSTGATVRVTNLVANTLRTNTPSPNPLVDEDSVMFRIEDSLKVTKFVEIDQTLLVTGTTILDSNTTINGTTLTHGTLSESSISVTAPYLGINKMTQVPFLRMGSPAGVVIDPNTWPANFSVGDPIRKAARIRADNLPAFLEVDGVVLVGPDPIVSPLCLRHISGSVNCVYVDGYTMIRYAPFRCGPITFFNFNSTLSGSWSINARGDLQSSVQVAAPSYRLLGAATADEVLLTAPAAGLTSDKRVIAPTYRIAAEADLTPITGGGTNFSTKINVPQIQLRNSTVATTIATHQTDSDGAARIVTPYLRIEGAMEVEFWPTTGGTRIKPGVLDLAYNTPLSTLSYIRIQALNDGLHLYTNRLFMQNDACSLLSDATNGRLTTSNLPTLSLDSICELTATIIQPATASSVRKTQTSIVTDVLRFGPTDPTTLPATVPPTTGPAPTTTMTPEKDGVLMGPSSTFAFRATSIMALQAPTSVDMVLRRPDNLWSRFQFQAGSKGELRINGRDAGLTPYDALAGSSSFTAADPDGWYPFYSGSGGTGTLLFRSRRYDLARPELVRSTGENFVLPGFTDSLFTGTSPTTLANGFTRYINPLGGAALSYTGAWVDFFLETAISLKMFQTVLMTPNQIDRRPSVWRLYTRDGFPGAGVVVEDWVERMRGGTAESTLAPDRELSVYKCFRLAVSQVSSGNEMRVGALSLWGVDAMPTVTPQNSFTGQHWTVPAQGQDVTVLRPGMVVVASGQRDSINVGGFKARGGASSIRSDSALPRVQLTDVAGDPRPFGVIDSWKENAWVDFRDKRLVINSLGEGAVLVCSKNGNIRNGDLLQTSSMAGYCERQDDDLVRSRTVAKATMDCDFNPQQVPKMRLITDEAGRPVYDMDGLLLWEPTGEFEPEYETTIFASQGIRVAMISCVYMCG